MRKQQIVIITDYIGCGQVLSTVDDRPSPVDHTQRPALHAEHDELFGMTASRSPSALADISIRCGSVTDRLTDRGRQACEHMSTAAPRFIATCLSSTANEQLQLHRRLYLRIAEFVPLWDHIELDSIYSSRQQCSTDQQDCQDQVRKCSREIDHLNIVNSYALEVSPTTHFSTNKLN